jgi:hypothetical protein
VQREQEISYSIHSKLLSLLGKENCTVTFPESNLLNETVLPLCDSDSTIHITYRASLISVEGCFSRDLVNSIDAWRMSPSQEPVVAEDSSLQFSNSIGCPTYIDHHSAPLCISPPTCPTPELNDPSVSRECPTPELNDPSVSRECPTTTTMLVAYLLAEFGLLTTLYAVITFATVCIIRTRKK